MAASRPLSLRTPQAGWAITAIVASLCVYGLSWFVFSVVINLDEPLLQTRQLMLSSLFWMICALVMWNLTLPPSRLHAVLGALMCVFFVSLMGTVVAFVLLVLKGAEVDARLLTTFAMLSGALLVAQLFLAIPAAVLLQQIALKRASV